LIAGIEAPAYLRPSGPGETVRGVQTKVSLVITAYLYVSSRLIDPVESLYLGLICGLRAG